MEYQEYFTRVIRNEIIIFIFAGIAIIYLLLNKSYWMDLRLKQRNKQIILYKVIAIVFLFFYVWNTMLPVIYDMHSMRSNEYERLNNAEVITEISQGGPFGMTRRITVVHNNQKYRLIIANSDNYIKKGDIVDVVYLPHTSYAVISRTNDS